MYRLVRVPSSWREIGKTGDTYGVGDDAPSDLQAYAAMYASGLEEVGALLEGVRAEPL